MPEWMWMPHELAALPAPEAQAVSSPPSEYSIVWVVPAVLTATAPLTDREPEYV